MDAPFTIAQVTASVMDAVKELSEGDERGGADEAPAQIAVVPASDAVLPASDVELVQRMAAGRREALGELYDRYAPILTGLGLRMLNERARAEDLLHEVFLEAWEKAATYDEARGTVRAWLLLRMRSRCLDRLKAADRRLTRTLHDSDAQRSTGDEHAWTLGDAERLHAALRALPEVQREALELGYFEGLSSSEMATRLGLPLGTIKSRVAAALARLRALLGAGGSEPGGGK